MVQAIGLDIFLDVATHEPDLSAFDPAVGLFERELAVAQALHLAPDQDDAAFERVEDFIVMPGATIDGDRPFVVSAFVAAGTFF